MTQGQGHLPPGRRGFEAAKARRAKFLELYASGLSVAQSCERIGVSMSCYAKWRKRFPNFAAEMNLLRGGHRALKHPDPGTFTGFRKKYFHYDTYLHQARIIYEIEEAKPGEVVLILVPPEGGKTTLLEDYCNFRIARDPNIRITLVSEGQPHARKILGRVQRRMVDHQIAPDYMADFGPFKTLRSEAMGKRWSADMFTVATSDHDERDFTMEARGWTSRIAGTRTDLLLIDDIQSAVSLANTEKMLTVFRQDMLTRPGRSGITIIVGTRVGNLDFYEAIQNEGVVDRTVVISALDENDESYCPEMWPVDALYQRRTKVGEDVWWRTYMQKPRMGGASTFSMDLLDSAKDIAHTVGHIPEPSLRIVGLDPSVTNWNCFVTTAADKDGLHVVDLRRDTSLGSTEAVLAKLDVIATQYKPNIVVVEQNAFQKALANDERLRTLGRIHGFVVRAHTTGRNKLDESLGVARMPTSFVQGQMFIPWADDAARTVFGPLVEELHNWRSGPTWKVRQDLVMALWFCWLEWQSRLPSLTTVPSWRTVALPWAPTGNPLRAQRKAS